MQFRLIRSATVTLGWPGTTLLVDPYLAPRGAGRSYGGTHQSPLVDLPLPVADLLAGVDGVFVSHLHSDHFDDTARERLPRSLPMLCPAALAPRLREWGFGDVQPIGESLVWRGAEFTLTGGRHGPDEILHALGEVNGFVWRAPGEPTLYWVGDSIWCPEVDQALRQHAPQVVVVHACGATWRGQGPLVMDAAQVEAVLRAAPASNVVATHLDVVDHATVSRADLASHFEGQPALAARLRIPADGECLSFQATGCP